MASRRRLRGWMMVWAVLQFALPTAASYADALLERVSASAQATHIESTAARSCVAVHPANCALCQLVHRGGTPGPTAPPQFASARVSPPHALAASDPIAAASRRLALPRAPPTV